MRLPVSAEQMTRELKGVEDILRKWRLSLQRGEVPGVQQPGDEVALNEYLTEMVGELVLASGRCDALVRALADPGAG